MQSSLATGQLLAPVMTNTWGKRPGKVTKFTPHCAVGLLSAKRICEILNGKGASASYVIGKDGEIWSNVLEENAPGTSSSQWNDQQAITVECACDLSHPYKFPDKVWNSLVALAKDIIKRHGIGKLVFTGDRNGSLTYHKFYSPTACPGQWFIDNTQRFVNEVNNTSGGNTDPVTPPTTGKLNTADLAKAIARGDFGNAPARWDNLKKAGYTQAEIDAAQKIVDGGLSTPSQPSTPPATNKPDQILNPGDKCQFSKNYKLEKVDKKYNVFNSEIGAWLNPSLITETDKNGNPTADQRVDDDISQSYFKVPGTWIVESSGNGTFPDGWVILKGWGFKINPRTLVEV